MRASRLRRSATRSGSGPALAQPAAIKIVADFAKEIGAAKFFDAGDVQANGFQIVEDDRTGDTFTETGASYMGFAVERAARVRASPTSRATASPSPATAPS